MFELPYAIVNAGIMLVSNLPMTKKQDALGGGPCENCVTSRKLGYHPTLAGPSKRFDIQGWSFHVAIRWYTLIFPSIEEVLAFMADKCPFCECAAGVRA